MELRDGEPRNAFTWGKKPHKKKCKKEHKLKSSRSFKPIDYCWSGPNSRTAGIEKPPSTPPPTQTPQHNRDRQLELFLPPQCCGAVTLHGCCWDRVVR
ncbi:hypothetical protein J6590_056823 [Homalodisca vitripennis]|nr:hypothetical protein J6590_056823 [Homalodisca vitripennis]